jgi:glycosyltransferase involved in cell wall biosynthesis
MTTLPEVRRLVFVSSCFNEAGNVRDLHRRCRAVHQQIVQHHQGAEPLAFAMVIADNCSTDGTLAALEQLAAEDSAVLVLANASNYGPEASVANALTHTRDSDLVVVLASDLQDPPELTLTLLQELWQAPGCDGVLAVKSHSTGSAPLRLCRRLYYLALGYSSRLHLVPSGFHGFGLYRQHALAEALELWRSTGWSLRLCLINGCQSTRSIRYRQAERSWGRTSYQGLGYPKEALMALLSADSTGSRLAFLLGSAGLLAASGVGLFLLINWLSGNSGYERGVPTVMALVLGSFAVQMLMIALLSLQVEELKLAGRLRPRVRHRIIGRQT